MLKYAILISGVLFAATTALAQQGVAAKPSGNTYAVVIGISSYTNNGIGKLDFAHRDAEAFALYLRSGAGGYVPEGNIRLLLNQQATYSAIYNALYWLLDTCKKNDLVYFYFSGHGDVENNTIYKLGFLLASNTPRFNYINNAIRIEDVNNIANTLSVEKGARVIIITDACRSGKLAGDAFRGNLLVGQQLRTARGNEVRISSCGPDELSNEDEGWAGGRGVFSYYLVRGLEGMADSSRDQTVTLGELSDYLRKAMAADRLLAQKEHKQHPVIQGPGVTYMSQAIPMVHAVVTPDAAAQGKLSQLGISPQGYLLGLQRNRKLESVLDFEKLSRLSADEIPFAIIGMLSVPASKTDSIDNNQVNRLISSIRSNPDAMRRFRDKLAEMMADRGQEVINLYLEGDEAELERRRYYNSVNNGYGVYVKMFETARKLLTPLSQLQHILEVKQHYFAGVSARLQMPLVTASAPLLEQAFREQLKALALEENAAYIHNELGILYRYKKDPLKARQHFLRATLIAPTWALPWLNLAGLSINQQQTTEAATALEKARQLQPELQGLYNLEGLLEEQKENWLGAEENYRKSIRLNSRHYIPFERLGMVCLATTRYAEADSNLLEADKRKRGYNFLYRDSEADGVTDMMEVMSPYFPCRLDTAAIGKDDILAHYYLAGYYLMNGDSAKAEARYKYVISLDPSHPLAYEKLGMLLYGKKRWKEADIILNFAIRFHRDSNRFSAYCDSMIRVFPKYREAPFDNNAKNDWSCLMTRFRLDWRPQKIARFFLASVYEHWNHFDEAGLQYREVIREEPFENAAYIKLCSLMERAERFDDAEKALMLFPDRKITEQELSALYSRIIQKHPDRGEWFRRAGSLLYDIVARGPGEYPDDRKEILPDTREETYFGKTVYREQMQRVYKVPGTGEPFYMYEPVEFPITEGIHYLRKADSLLFLEDELAEINRKTGELYVWQGLPQKAEPFFAKALSLRPGNANTRLNFIYSTITNFNYSLALSELDTLYQNGQINYQAQVLMARYSIYKGRFDDASRLLTEAKEIHPQQPDELTDLEARMHWIAKRPRQAISVYQALLNKQPRNADAMYTIARAYGALNNSREAWKWLELSLKNGFNYYWVLKTDSSWDAFRKQPKWTALTRHIRSKE